MPNVSEDDVLHNHAPVQSLVVVVHTLGAISPHLSDNHWSIYLKLQSHEQKSVRMNIRQLQDDDPTGTLIWSELDYWITHSAIKAWEFRVPQGLCVSHVAQLVYDNDRDKFEFSGGGSGCRYWM